MVNGHCDEKFSELKNILEQQLNSDFELGASVAVEWKGKEVVNPVSYTHLTLPTKEGV